MIDKVLWLLCFHSIAIQGEQPNESPDLFHFFHAESNADLPDYQVVEITTRNFGNGGKYMALRASGSQKLLKLKPVSEKLHADVPIIQLLQNSLDPTGYTLEELPQNSTPIKTYQDEDNHAALVIQPHEDGTFSVEGTIGHNMVLKPIPAELLERFLTEPVRKKRSDNNPESRPNDQVFLNDMHQDIEDDENMATGEKIVKGETFQKHLIYKLPRLGQDKHTSDYLYFNMDGEEKRKRRSVRNKRQVPETVYVDTLIYVDHISYKAFGEDAEKIKKYQSAFWNAVDLRFRSLKSPKVRIHLSSIIIAKDASKATFITPHLTGNNMLRADGALDDMGKFLFEIKPRIKAEFDIAITVTTIDICSRDSNGGCGRSTTGLAYVAGACVTNRRSQKMVNAGLVEDSGGYSGVMTAAHEVGHLLGSVHDGEPSPQYENLPGSEGCSFQDGYIMSYLHTDNSFRWSPCSANTFRHFLKGEGASCLYNAPRKPKKLVVPNKLMSLDEQCRKDRGTKSCFKDYRVCTQLFCYNKGSSGGCTAFRPAVDGSYCGNNQHCLDGKCVKKKK